MDLLLGQLVYTSFPGVGLRTLQSAQVPPEIQEAFIQQVVYQHWDSYNPPTSEYRAVYLYQVTPEQSLFGWLYNDGADDVGRSHVPYFICYYLGSPLLNFQLEIIFTCLHQGPVALIDRHSLDASLPTTVIPDLWSYRGVRSGVAIPLHVRKRSHLTLKQGKMLDLFVPVNEQEVVAELNEQTYEPQTAKLSFYFYNRYIFEGIETGVATLNEDAAVIETGVIKTQQEYKENLQRYEQELVSAIQREHPISDDTRNSLKHWQQVLRLTDEDIESIEARIAQQTKGHDSNQSIIICACWLSS